MPDDLSILQIDRHIDTTGKTVAIVRNNTSGFSGKVGKSGTTVTSVKLDLSFRIWHSPAFLTTQVVFAARCFLAELVRVPLESADDRNSHEFRYRCLGGGPHATGGW
jgi:hypothetical protein